MKDRLILAAGRWVLIAVMMLFPGRPLRGENTALAVPAAAAVVATPALAVTQGRQHPAYQVFAANLVLPEITVVDAATLAVGGGTKLAVSRSDQLTALDKAALAGRLDVPVGLIEKVAGSFPAAGTADAAQVGEKIRRAVTDYKFLIEKWTKYLPPAGAESVKTEALQALQSGDTDKAWALFAALPRPAAPGSVAGRGAELSFRRASWKKHWPAGIAVALVLAGIFAGLPAACGITTNVIVTGGSFTTYAFSPKVINIQAGDQVLWTGLGSIHSVTGDTPPETLCGGSFPGSCSNVFNTPGAYVYHCINHVSTSSMTGLVNVAAVPLPPVVVLTNPAGGAVFAAPASVLLAAAVTNTSGTVTNVQFFGNGGALGADATAPFSLTTGPLAAGAYALTAKAMATSGLATTSAAVNITVVTPVAVSNFFPRVSNGLFVFDHTANAGLRYVVESTDTFTNWSPVVTNTAQGSNVEAVDVFQAGGLRFYRVGRLPNP